MSFSPYLGFPGNAREAMSFYAEVFGATDLQIMDNSTAPEGQGTGGAANSVMHAQFSAGPGAPLMGADLPEGWPGGMGGASVFHAAPTLERAAEVFARLSAGGEVFMPFGPTFWSPGFGGCQDRFGTRWMITVAPSA